MTSFSLVEINHSLCETYLRSHLVESRGLSETFKNYYQAVRRHIPREKSSLS